MMLLFAVLLPVLSGATAEANGAVKLAVPQVQYKINEASASRSPWIDANGWQILRKPAARFYYDVPGKAAALAAAEAFAYGAHAAVHTDAAGAAAFKRMVDFLGALPETDLPALANIGVVEDGTAQTGELMNLLTRRNLLFRVVTAPDPALQVNVHLGDQGYPKDEDPNLLAQRIRSAVTDEKRLVRLYGSEVVVARLTGAGGRARLHLLNYSNRPVVGLHVRVLGVFPSARIAAFDKPDARLQDVNSDGGATEFTVVEMGPYAVVDLGQ
jgi:hypothetical protein